MPTAADLFLTRRQTLRLATVSVSGIHFLPWLAPTNVRAAGTAKPRGTARFCLFFMLDGGQSHVDGWDLKEGKWTPPDFDVREVRPGLKWPMALYPNLAKQLERVTLVRSLNAWDAVHGRAQYYVQAAHPFNPALQKEIPPIGTVAAMELSSQRRANDCLPGYVALNVHHNQAGLLRAGMLPAVHAPFHIDTETSLSAYAADAATKDDFLRRWEMLKSFDGRMRTDASPAAKAFRDFHDHYEGAVRLMADERTAPLFDLKAEERKRYGSSATGDAAIIARNLIHADAGTRFIFLQQKGWDHHSNIYEAKNHYAHSRELDSSLAALIEDLATTKRPGGQSLLDETMVICLGEFGRTPGDVNGLKGRDHYQHAYTGLFAGGGVQAGQIIGKTDETGAKVIESGWEVKRPIFMEDIATTVYSALGIDWKKSIHATPSGREYYYVEPVSAQAIQPNREIGVLFKS